MTKRLTKGGALIKARDLLGPDAMVYTFVGQHHIGRFTSDPRYSDGVCPVEVTLTVDDHPDWESALNAVIDTKDARDWHDHQIAAGNEIAKAKQSLATTTKELALKKYQEFMQRMVQDEQAKAIAKGESAREYKEWQAKREARFAR